MNQKKNKNANDEIANEDILKNSNNSSVNEEINKPDGDVEALNNELNSLKEQLDLKDKKCEEYLGMLQRTAAEFDNYKKRTIREREAQYTDAVADTVKMFLTVADNLERALDACNKESEIHTLKEGVELTLKQLKEVFKNLGVEEIKAVGEKFDPNMHNAVMHIEDEAFGDNEVVEEFQKGYKIKDKVVRFSMVRVAN